MTAPQPPSESAEPPRPVIRKLGFARATTNPSNQLMVLRSSRSSTTAVAMRTSGGKDVGKSAATKQDSACGVKRMILHAADATYVRSHISAAPLASGWCDGGRCTHGVALHHASLRLWSGGSCRVS